MAAVETRPLGALGRMGVVVAFHVALVFVLANSFGLIPKSKPPEMVGVVIDETPPIEQPPPVNFPVETSQAEAYVPAPDDPQIDRDTDGGAITAKLVPVGEIPIGPGPVLPDPVPQTGVRSDPRHPLTQPPYPAQMIREGHEGAVDVEVFVQPNGRVTDARIAKGSGFDAFDRATLDEARAWRLLPAMRGDEPFAQWYRLRVVFKLKNQQ